jgi:hypothetical protein
MEAPLPSSGQRSSKARHHPVGAALAESSAVEIQASLDFHAPKIC